MKWRLIRIVGLLVSLLAVLAIAFLGRPKTVGEGVRRSEVARSLALLQVSSVECAAVNSYFPESEPEQWFVKYANYLYEAAWWTTVETPANAEAMSEDYTYAELWGLLDRIGCASRWTARQESGWDKTVSRQVWERVWEELREQLDVSGVVQEATVVIYGTPAEMEGLEPWTAMTNIGTMQFDGLNLNGCVDREVRVWLREGEILRVSEIVQEEICYENALILELTAGRDAGSDMRVFVDGAEKQYHMETALSAPYEMVLADVTLQGGEVVQIDVKPDTITGKVLAVKAQTIEIAGYGEVPRAETLCVYQSYGGIAQKSEQEIHLGGETQTFFVAEGKVCGVLTAQAPQATSIRVLLKTTGFRGTVHERVEMTCDQRFQVTYGDRIDLYQPGQIVSWTPDADVLQQGRVTVEPLDGGRLQILTLERASGVPSYGGRLEMLAADGGIVLINELLLEDYLALVLPSEMPESYGLEALKAQAVSARSYAYRQMNSQTYRHYGAHVDDSSSYQVYNNTAPSLLAAQAVRETYGQVLTYQGEVVTTYYYSTSCGHSTNGAAWGGDAARYPYLEGQWLTTSSENVDLTDEASFRAFITQVDEGAYEVSFPWYRWQTTVPLQALNDRINAYLAATGETEQIRVLQQDGSFALGAVRGIGALTGAEVVRRGVGGVAEVLELKGTEGCVQVYYQNAIRQILGVAGSLFARTGGEYVSQSEMLPSAYMYLEPQYTGDLLTGYTIYGGGSGHGAGMSQNAACYLARIGKTYEDILAQFYKDCILARLY